MKSLLLAAAAVLSLGFAAPAAAAADDGVPLGMVGGWEIRQHSTWCSGVGGFANGTFLGFNVGSNGAATIIIANDQWKIPKGTYPVVVSVDRTPPVTFTGHGDGLAVTMNWSLTPSELQIMSTGAVFRAKVGSAFYEYGLKGSAGMLSALIKCAGGLAAAGNPFASKPAASDPFAETASNPYRRM
jgi:hypothetical protein